MRIIMQPNEQPHGQYHQAHALVEGLHGLRGFHPGYRTVHALGRIYRGTFTASGDGAALTRAVHFQPGATTPATARFSSSAADPEAPLSPVAAIAVKFYLDDGTVTDLVSLSLPLFPLPTPDDYLRFFAVAADPAGKAALLAERPKIAAALQEIMTTIQAPKSLAETAYNAIHAFWFENAAGQRRAGRYHWVPEAGESGQTVAELQALPNDSLFNELEERLARGPVRFALYLSLAEEGDDLSDPSTAWPPTRERVVLGHLALQRRTSTEEIGDPIMIHDPTRTTDGIDVSDDPVLNVRRGVYEVSAVNRGAGWQSRAAAAAAVAGAS
jgi:catalase